MTVKLTIELTEALERKAREQGLLQPDRVAKLIEREVGQEKARDEFRRMLDEVRGQPGEPMSLEEIQAEVDAVRFGRQRERESGR